MTMQSSEDKKFIDVLERRLMAYQKALNAIDDLMEYRGMSKEDFAGIAARLSKTLQGSDIQDNTNGGGTGGNAEPFNRRPVQAQPTTVGNTGSPAPDAAPATDQPDECAMVLLGHHYLEYEEGQRTGWTQNVTRRGDRLIVDLRYTYHEGPGYKPPEQYRFALKCIDRPTERESVELQAMRQAWGKRKEQLVALANLADAYEAGFTDGWRKSS